MNYSHSLIVISLLAYALASGFYVHAFPKPDQRQKYVMAGFLSFLAATVTMTAVIITSRSYGQYTQLSGLVLIATISWLSVIGFFKVKLKMLGTFVAPFATFIILLQFFTAPRHGHVLIPGTSGWGYTHIIFSLLGEAFAICACAVSVMYLLQQQALKKKQLARINSATPPIDKLERTLIASLWVGFTFITLALISGAIYTQFFLATITSSLGTKIVWAMAVWLWYLITLLARNIFNVSGRKIAWMSLWGFLLLMIALFGLTGIQGGA